MRMSQISWWTAAGSGIAVAGIAEIGSGYRLEAAGSKNRAASS
jgi:hypothetical protein